MGGKESVLIGCPTYEKQGYCLDRFAARLKELTFKDKEVLFVDNSSTPEYAEKIRAKGFRVIYNPVMQTGATKNSPYDISPIISNRNIIIKEFLAGKYTHLLWLDTDVLVPTDAIERLLKHDKPITFGIYLGGQKIKGTVKLAPVIYDFAPKEGYLKMVPVNRVMGEEVFEVLAGGFGCCLIKKEVVKAVQLRQNKELGGGEDILFCKDAREKGFRSYADTSIKCTHMRPERDYEFPVFMTGFSTGYSTERV